MLNFFKYMSSYSLLKDVGILHIFNLLLFSFVVKKI